MLTTDDAKTLTAYFEASEHEFLRSNPYIREWAICDRIEQVDPAWSFEIVRTEHRTNAGSTDAPIITVYGRMTIKGVTREGVGMASANVTKSGDTEANEPEKSAATDCLKRAARLFGVGRYLLKLPDSVKDDRTMTAWINQRTGKVTPINHTATTETPPVIETGLLATKAKYIQSGQSQFVAFNTENRARLYGRDKLRQLGDTWQKWADALTPGNPDQNAVDLPGPILLTTEQKTQQQTGEIYYVVTDIEGA